MSSNIISNIYITEAVRKARSFGFDVDSILQHSGITPEQLQNPHGQITARQYTEVSLAIMRLINDELPSTGGRRRVPFGSFAMMCHAIIHLPTLKQALLRGCQFYNRLMGDIHIRLRVHGERATLSITWDDPDMDHKHVTTESMLTLIHRFSCWLIDQNFPLIEASFTYAPPEHMPHYNRLFRCPLHFNQTQAAIVFNTGYLDYLVMQNEVTLRSFLRAAPANLFILPESARVVSGRIVALLGRDFTREFPDFETVAETLHMTPQTLRRKLRDETTSYQEIKDNLRRNAAISYLSKPQLSISEIAQIMGFSEPSTFHRAFKKWTGRTPGEYRDGLA